MVGRTKLRFAVMELRTDCAMGLVCCARSRLTTRNILKRYIYDHIRFQRSNGFKFSCKQLLLALASIDFFHITIGVSLVNDEKNLDFIA
jgi:hypothetical protein